MRHALLHLATVGLLAATSAAALPELTIEDAHFATRDGQPVSLRGVNVGNWLLIEPWMLGVADQGMGAEYAFDQLLIERFGEARHAELKKAWRDNWIQADDFAAIRDFGFNTVRVPFHHAVIEDMDNLGHIADGGFEYLDRAVRWAADNDLYVILDMHAAPEHQSKDGPSGRVDYNRLWKDEAAQGRFVSLWREIAERYKDEPNVAGYDLVNEPWGDFNDAHADVYGRTIDRAVQAVREVDDDTPILVAALLGGNFSPFEQQLNDRDAHPAWRHIALTDHYYPGLFGSEPVMLSHARHVANLADRIEQYRGWGTPLVVGEMQVVFERLEQPRLMRWYFDYYNSLGWAPVAWSWKLAKPEAGVQADNWYCVTNAEPWAVDLRSDSFEKVMSEFERLGEMEWVPDAEYRAAMRADEGDLEPFELPDPQLGPTELPTIATPAGWSLTPIGDRARGGVTEADGNTLALAGGGQDIFGSRDEFLFLQCDDANGELAVTIDAFDAAGQWAKAGVMIRASDAPDAPFALIHVFPSGRITMAARAEAGDAAVEQHLVEDGVGYPVRLVIRHGGGSVEVGYAANGEELTWLTPPAQPTLGSTADVGIAITSNVPGRLAEANFQIERQD